MLGEIWCRYLAPAAPVSQGARVDGLWSMVGDPEPDEQHPPAIATFGSESRDQQFLFRD